MTDIRESLGCAEEIGGGGKTRKERLDAASPFTNLKVLVDFIISYFQPDPEDENPRAVLIDGSCLKRIMELPFGVTEPPDDWLACPILLFQWNLDSEDVQLLWTGFKKEEQEAIQSNLRKERMTLDQFVGMLISEQPPGHPLHRVFSGGNELGPQSGRCTLPNTAHLVGLFDHRKKNKEEDHGNLVREDFDGFDELSKKISGLVASYLEDGLCGSHGDATTKTKIERLDAVYGLGVTVSHAAAYQGALLNDRKVKPTPDLSTRMTSLLKVSLGLKDTKKKRENQSLVDFARNRSAFGFAVDHAPVIRRKYEELVQLIQTRTKHHKFKDTQFLPIPDTTDSVNDYSDVWDANGFDDLLAETQLDLREDDRRSYEAIKYLMQPPTHPSTAGKKESPTSKQDSQIFESPQLVLNTEGSEPHIQKFASL
jgi:hypothetical protein